MKPLPSYLGLLLNFSESELITTFFTYWHVQNMAQMARNKSKSHSPLTIRLHDGIINLETLIIENVNL